MNCDVCGCEVPDPGYDAGSVTCLNCRRDANREAKRNAGPSESEQRMIAMAEDLTKSFERFSDDYARLMDSSYSEERQAAASLAQAMAGIYASKVALELARFTKEAVESA
jgi:hypothetical protein